MGTEVDPQYPSWGKRLPTVQQVHGFVYAQKHAALAREQRNLPCRCQRSLFRMVRTYAATPV